MSYCIYLFLMFLSFRVLLLFIFFFNDTATTEIYTLSYTTLFRSQPLAGRRLPRLVPQRPDRRGRRAGLELRHRRGHRRRQPRSEEHTSELQSRRDLVCRLLLEKKKKKQ